MKQKQKSKTIIISLGGSIVAPDKINIKFLKDFKKLILRQVKLGKKFVIIVGGGKICRNYQNAAQKVCKLSTEQLDWIGIHSTHLNASLIREIFGDQAEAKIIKDLENLTILKKPIIIGAGTKPGWSTDYDAVFLAEKYKAKTVANLSNIEYVYDKDPKKFKNAKPLKNISWPDFLKIIGEKWKAGMNAPFDPIASRLAKKIRLKAVFLKGTNLKNFEKFLKGEKFKGTVIE
jgi:uridylate kinase